MYVRAVAIVVISLIGIGGSIGLWLQRMGLGITIYTDRRIWRNTMATGSILIVVAGLVLAGLAWHVFVHA